MTTKTRQTIALISLAASLFIAGCALSPPLPEGAAEVRAKLTALQSDPALAGDAPVAIKEAEDAVLAAENAAAGSDRARHLVYVADRKVEIARAQAEGRQAEEQREGLRDAQESARLEARTREADTARGEAASARSEAASARAEADSQRRAAELAQSDADMARMETSEAQKMSDELRQQLGELNARQTDRGLVVTLGDVLFSTDSVDLKGGPAGDLNKLAAFLKRYPERTVLIEGHTDNTGSDDYNQQLSQRRAESVKNFLVAQGIGSERVRREGKGESAPVSSNDSATGRQQNRRVEVIIENEPAEAP